MQQHDRSPARGEGPRALARGARALASAAIVAGAALHPSPCAAQATEHLRIVGDMLRRARAAGIDPGPLRAAWCHLQAAERIRERARAAMAGAASRT